MVGHAQSDGSTAPKARQLRGSGSMLPQNSRPSEMVSGTLLFVFYETHKPLRSVPCANEATWLAYCPVLFSGIQCIIVYRCILIGSDVWQGLGPTWPYRSYATVCHSSKWQYKVALLTPKMLLCSNKFEASIRHLHVQVLIQVYRLKDQEYH